jgi:hypothetical protein
MTLIGLHAAHYMQYDGVNVTVPADRVYQDRGANALLVLAMNILSRIIFKKNYILVGPV